ncbi:MAG: hypothetical protein LBF08_04485 [Dysgonamonadaceae bacterium]|jgi:hypothetical protein|nr:hypothetical protein [Dysgonamonadaceae bacterium]
MTREAKLKRKERREREFKDRMSRIPQEKKSKICLYWESLEGKEPPFDIIDMRAVLK